jgi:hypothetical protein
VVQTALLSARLADATVAGCDIAVVTSQPGSKSRQNVQRQGFDSALHPCRSGEAAAGRRSMTQSAVAMVSRSVLDQVHGVAVQLPGSWYLSRALAGMRAAGRPAYFAMTPPVRGGSTRQEATMTNDEPGRSVTGTLVGTSETDGTPAVSRP